MLAGFDLILPSASSSLSHPMPLGVFSSCGTPFPCHCGPARSLRRGYHDTHSTEPLSVIAYAHFLSGPPGGHTLPLTSTRLSDREGGIYGSHASWASTSSNARRAVIKASSAVARGETEREILEYYQYHSDRDSYVYTVRLGGLFYHGSVYSIGGGVASGAEGVGEIPQSYSKAKEYFMKVARALWPIDFEANGQVAGKRKMSKEQENDIREPAMVAAAFLGRMLLRGEGGKPDYRKARMWFERAAELVSVTRTPASITPSKTSDWSRRDGLACADLSRGTVKPLTV